MFKKIGLQTSIWNLFQKKQKNAKKLINKRFITFYLFLFNIKFIYHILLFLIINLIDPKI